jgi:hypothetical protein
MIARFRFVAQRPVLVRNFLEAQAQGAQFRPQTPHAEKRGGRTKGRRDCRAQQKNRNA